MTKSTKSSDDINRILDIVCDHLNLNEYEQRRLVNVVSNKLKIEPTIVEIQEQRWFSSWRKSEAYQVPMTKEGSDLARERMVNFKRGFYYGQKDVYNQILKHHKKSKKIHNFYRILLDEIR